MPRIAAILLLLAFLLLGSGALSHVHALEHAREDAALADSGGDRDLPHRPHSHDESNCTFHALLRLPALASAGAPILVLIGVLFILPPALAPLLISLPLPDRLDCRGPPLS